MSKVSGSKSQVPSPKPASSGGFSGKSIGTKPIRAVSGPSINPGHVGPKNAPYLAKDAK